jgi:uncharacterized protein (UPF0333 family)
MDNPKIKAQVSIEFVISFVLLVLFAVLASRVFIWLGNTLVNRHIAYERTRSTAAPAVTNSSPTNEAKIDFFNNTTGKRPLDLFNATK